jgi:hypothetical protein
MSRPSDKRATDAGQMAAPRAAVGGTFTAWYWRFS